MHEDSHEGSKDQLIEHAKPLLVLLGKIAEDAFFTVVAFAVFVLADAGIAWLDPKAAGFAKLLVSFFQIVFGGSAAFLGLFLVYVDVRIAVIQGNQRLRRIERQSKKEQDNGEIEPPHTPS